MARFSLLRQNRATEVKKRAAMSSPDAVLQSLQAHPDGLNISELLGLHSDIPRRTLQRWLAVLVTQRKVRTAGAARARRYIAIFPWGTPAKSSERRSLTAALSWTAC